mgnify:CR=1 FL=1
MERKVGTVSRGIRCPIIREGDNLAKIVADSVIEAAESEGFSLRDRDVISVTESIVARSQGNYASVEAIAKDVKAKLGGETIGVIFPILSRNRFAICLRGIAKGVKKAVAKDGIVGIFTGGLTASAGGICAAIFFGYLGAIFSKSKEK